MNLFAIILIGVYAVGIVICACIEKQVIEHKDNNPKVHNSVMFLMWLSSPILILFSIYALIRYVFQSLNNYNKPTNLGV